MDILPDEVLALTIWGESRGESIDGQVAVANVVMNRWKNNLSKYKTVTDVCLEKNQFSCWNETDPNRSKMDKIIEKFERGQIPSEIKQQLYIARGVMGFNLYDNTKGARHYITAELFFGAKRPSWAKIPIGDPVKIGNHVFFNV